MEPGLRRRLERAVDVDAAVALLGEHLARRDAAALLIAAHRRRTSATGVRDVLRQWQDDRFVQPSAVPPALTREIDRLAARLLPVGFEEVELSPLCPLGTTRALAGIDQARVVSTIRHTDVVADQAAVLALEAARRVAADHAPANAPAPPMRLWSSHRVVRADPPRTPGHRASFRLIALCTAARAGRRDAVELDALSEHLAFHVALLAALPEVGLPSPGVRCAVTPLPGGPPAAAVEERVLEPLRARFPDVALELDPGREQGRSYYSRAAFAVAIRTPDGERHAVADGGFTDWHATLLSDRRRRLLTSGIGTERLCALLSPVPGGPDRPTG
jgi:hypothetical protein